jgi:uncharacterized protein (TIGR03067 family)
MRWFALAGIGFLVLTSGFHADLSARGGDMDQELQKFNGTWKVLSMKINGNTIEDKKPVDARVVIQQGKFKSIASTFGMVSEGMLTIDPKKEPKELTFAYTSGTTAGKKQLGIYKFDANKLTICFSPTGNPQRPTAFASPMDSDLILVEWEKVK